VGDGSKGRCIRKRGGVEEAWGGMWSLNGEFERGETTKAGEKDLMGRGGTFMVATARQTTTSPGRGQEGLAKGKHRLKKAKTLASLPNCPDPMWERFTTR